MSLNLRGHVFSTSRYRINFRFLGKEICHLYTFKIVRQVLVPFFQTFGKMQTLFNKQIDLAKRNIPLQARKHSPYVINAE